MHSCARIFLWPILLVLVSAGFCFGADTASETDRPPLTPSQVIERGYFFLDRAEKYMHAGRYGDAFPEALAAVEDFRAANHPDGLARALNTAGNAAWQQGMVEKAESRFREAFEVARSADLRGQAGQALAGLAMTYDRRDHDRAIRYFRQALAWLDRPEDRAAALAALQGLGDVYVSLGRFDEAFETYGKALDLARSAGDPAAEARQRDYLGYFHRTLGNYEKAAEMHRSALVSAGRIDDPNRRLRALARAYNHLGLSVAARAGTDQAPENKDEALDRLSSGIALEEKALGFAREAGDRHRQGYVLRALADLHRKSAALMTGERRLEALTIALARASEAQELGASMGSREWEGLALHHRALALADMGRRKEAARFFERAAAIWTASGDVKFEAAARRFMAETLFVPDGRWDEAHAAYERSLDLYGRLRALDQISEVHLLQGGVYEKQGEFEKAREAYIASIEALEAMREKLPTEEQKVIFFERRQGPYEALIRLLIRMDRRSPGNGLAAQALSVSERARGRAILDMIAEAGNRIRGGVDEKTLAREQDIRERTHRALRTISQTLNKGRLAELRRELDGLDLEYTRLLRDIRKQNPGLAALKNPQPLGLKEIRSRILAPGEALLEYFIARDETYLFIVPPDGPLEVLTLPAGRRELADRIEALRLPFQKIKRIANWNVLTEFDPEQAHALYRTLFRPAEPYIRDARRVIVVPDGPLFYLPLEILVTSPPAQRSPKEDYFQNLKNVRFLVESSPPLSYAVSASTLDPDLRRGRTSPAKSGLKAWGNPIGGLETKAGYPIRLGGRDLILSPLPYSEEEVLNVSRLFAPRAEVYVGSEATKDRFLREAFEAEIILLSTHGVLNEEAPMFSALVFAPPPGEKSGELLETHEIFNLDLPARLITLSACEVGLGRIREGEGVMGLSRAFLFAGAESVVVSLWAVDDRATARLMTGFHERLHDDTRRKVEALWESKSRFLADVRRGETGEPLYLHPFFWGPFVLVEGVSHRPAASSQLNRPPGPRP